MDLDENLKNLSTLAPILQDKNKRNEIQHLQLSITFAMRTVRSSKLNRLVISITRDVCTAVT